MIVQKYLKHNPFSIQVSSEAPFTATFTLDTFSISGQGSSKKAAEEKIVNEAFGSPEFRQVLRKQKGFNETIDIIIDNYLTIGEIILNTEQVDPRDEIRHYFIVHSSPFRICFSLFFFFLVQTEKGVYWMLDYFRGKCSNYFYWYPYSSRPSVGDVVLFGKEPDKSLINFHSSTPLTPIEFCLAVLPKSVKKRVWCLNVVY